VVAGDNIRAVLSAVRVGPVATGAASSKLLRSIDRRLRKRRDRAQGDGQRQRVAEKRGQTPISLM
jgi:hypothetical protein